MIQIAAVIQSRMGSTRFPGKALCPLAGAPMTEHIIKRLKQVKEFDAIVLAVPEGMQEQPLVDLAAELGIESVRGPEEDVLRRFILAGEKVEAENIVRICGDNPLLDPELARRVIRSHLKSEADYTVPEEPIPLGTGMEAVRFAALKEVAEKVSNPIFREHVTTFFQIHPENYKIGRVPPPDYLRGKNLRLTVDTEQDARLMERIYDKFSNLSQSIIDLEIAIAYLEAHPELIKINAAVVQKDWRRGI